MQRLRPAFVLTFSAVAACGTSTQNPPGPIGPLTSQPPEPPATATGSQVATGNTAQQPLTEGAILNPYDAEHRMIYRSYGGKCHVNLPFDEPPKGFRPPPTKEIDCPPSMASDPAWADCVGGTINVKKVGPPLSCECSISGNPPPPERDVACPKDTGSGASP